ncbi:hypothetical protein V3470_01895 [Flavobacterium oreochromis]|uniref:Peptidase C39-like domain-containing protein n=1 Tax=Flavobacterium oreochromis TaxID=2906078 RepID=A0ABW8P5R1_9FLAO|nr:hypothetical protein [Flavobacterium oreochromis]OWP76359.1 hypothetical protein BWG23_08340 [Flavobacterium oreochromis]
MKKNIFTLYFLFFSFFAFAQNGFYPVMDPIKSTNSHCLTENCYYCSTAALLNTTVTDLVASTGIMQQDTAQIDEIIDLFRNAGVRVRCITDLDEATAYCLLSTLPNGQSAGLAYTRQGGSGHMIVVTRDTGYYNNGVNPGLKCIDYQSNPPRITGFPYEGGNLVYNIFAKN